MARGVMVRALTIDEVWIAAKFIARSHWAMTNGASFLVVPLSSRNCSRSFCAQLISGCVMACYVGYYSQACDSILLLVRSWPPDAPR